MSTAATVSICVGSCEATGGSALTTWLPVANVLAGLVALYFGALRPFSRRPKLSISDTSARAIGSWQRAGFWPEYGLLTVPVVNEGKEAARGVRATLQHSLASYRQSAHAEAQRQGSEWSLVWATGGRLPNAGRPLADLTSGVPRRVIVCAAGPVESVFEDHPPHKAYGDHAWKRKFSPVFHQTAVAVVIADPVEQRELMRPRPDGALVSDRILRATMASPGDHSVEARYDCRLTLGGADNGDAALYEGELVLQAHRQPSSDEPGIALTSVEAVMSVEVV